MPVSQYRLTLRIALSKYWILVFRVSLVDVFNWSFLWGGECYILPNFHSLQKKKKIWHNI